MHTFHKVLEGVALGADVIGITLMVVGFSLSLFHLLRGVVRSGDDFLTTSRRVRCELGTYLLLGLEFMILSDIVQSALSRTLTDLAFLGVLVLIRTAIGFFLGRELAELQAE